MLMQDSYPVMIEGWVDDIVEECPLMMEVDGYTMDRYNDECEESVEVSPDAIVVKYGDYITFSIKGYPSTESITLQSSSPSERITVYYEDSQSHTIEGSIASVVGLCRCCGNEGGADSPGKAESASRDVGVEILLRPCAVCCFGMRRLVF